MVGVIGFMSGGKSYFAVEQMLGKMASNHVVCSNIILNCRAVSSYLGVPCVCWKPLYYKLVDRPSLYHEICVDHYEEYPQGSPRGSATYDRDMVFIFLDEASSLFDSMTAASDGGIRAVAAWARHTRKRGQEIFLLMQFASELHKRLRVHIVEYISCINSDTIKIPLLGTGLPSLLRGLSIRQRWLPDLKTPVGDSKWQRYNPKIYKCYNTSQIVVGSSSIGLTEVSRIDFTDVKIRSISSIVLVMCVLSVLFSLVGVVLL